MRPLEVSSNDSSSSNVSAIDCEAWHLAAVTILTLNYVGEWLGCSGDGSSRPELEPAAADPSSGKDAILTEAGAALAPQCAVAGWL